MTGNDRRMCDTLALCQGLAPSPDIGAAAQVEDQRNGATCNGGGTGLRAGAAAGCSEGAEILLRISCSAACSLVLKSRVICSWPAASWSTLWRTAARPSEIVLSS